MKNQLFIISKEARMSLSPDEIKATVEALKELNLYALPYPKVDVWVAADYFAGTKLDALELIEGERDTQLSDFIKRGIMVADRKGGIAWSNFGPGSWIEYRNLSIESPDYQKAICFYSNAHIRDCRLIEPQNFSTSDKEGERFLIIDALITLLATRNVVKTVERNKCAALGIGTKRGGKKAYEYVTTISVPTDLPEDEHEGKPTGTEKAPHLRRGHIRRQHFGPNNELIKRIWIAPVFVNADKDWVAQRKAYNLGVHHV